MSLSLPGWVTRNFQLKATAAGLALLVWAGVVYANNPPGSRTFTVPVRFEPAGTKWLLDTELQPLTLRVDGTKEHLDAFDPARVVARVDVSRITQQGVQDVPVVVINSDPAVDLEPPPGTVRADVDVIGTRRVAVQVKIIATPPAGFIPRPPLLSSPMVVVSGPLRVIQQITAEVDVDLGGVKTNYRGVLDVVLHDTAGNVVRNLGVSPSTLAVDMVIDSVATSRAVPVIVVTNGTVASGHSLGGIAVQPQTVVLSGTQSVLNSIDRVTVQVPLAGLFGTVTIGGLLVDTGDQSVTAEPSTVSVRITVLTPTPPATPPPTPTPRPTPTPSRTAPPTPTPTPSPSVTPGPTAVRLPTRAAA